MGDDTDGIRWTQVSRVGPWDAASLYGSAALTALCGPVMLGAHFLAGADLLGMGLVFTVVFLPVGLGLWAHTGFERESNRRLDAVGVPATAEITELTDWDDGESVGVTVGLRVVGPGFTTFETAWRRSSHDALRVGLRLTAVVDPSRGVFRVVF
ncbi:hypothetical protein ABZ490_33825 [Streptomyces sp. NPDC005811]|uniref:hypothetical protein n=1 Tax=Streptomyces sp. NPDC005811 TaxID=3154565 RepID=UPI0033F3C9C2